MPRRSPRRLDAIEREGAPARSAAHPGKVSAARRGRRHLRHAIAPEHSRTDPARDIFNGARSTRERLSVARSLHFVDDAEITPAYLETRVKAVDLAPSHPDTFLVEGEGGARSEYRL